MAMLVHNNTLKGAYKAPKYRCSGFENGVGFTRVYRSLKAAKKLGTKSGITFFQLVTLN